MSLPWGDAAAAAGAALAVLVTVRPSGGRLARLRSGHAAAGEGRRHRVSHARARRRAAPARDAPTPVELVLDLVAEVVAAGAPVPRAVSAVGEALRAVDDPQAVEILALAAGLATGRRPPPTDGGARGPTAAAVLSGALELALATGSSPVGPIRAAAQERRRLRSARSVQAARRLGVLVLLPTGLCLLPAFVLLTVVPMAVGLAVG